MTAHRIDRILLGLGAILILISSYQLFFKTSENSSGEILGTLTSTLSVVKTKSALSLDWRDATSGNNLTENQMIYTDNSSSAEVVFKQGSALVIGENSLVKLRSSGKDQAMDLSKGFIRAKLEGDKPLKVQMNGEDYYLSGSNADVQINMLDQKGEIGVLTGEVSVVSSGVTEKLDSTTALQINGDQVTKKSIYFTPVTPAKSATVYVLNSPSPVTFTWTPDESLSVSIGKKLSLEKARKFSGNSGLLIDLSPGLYYYRLESEKGISLVSSFRVIREAAPKLFRPLDGEEVSVLDESNSNVLLQWQQVEGLNYQLEWNDGEIKSSLVSGGSAMIDMAPGRPFSWRVKIQDAQRPDAVWSEWQNVSVTFVPAPSLPTELTPHEVEYQTYETPNEKVDLSWKGSDLAQLEIKNPKGELFEKKVEASTYQYIATQGGTYFWRVRALDSFLRKSEWSGWKTFIIEDLSTEKSTEGIQRIQLKKPDQSVTFNWKAEEGSTSVFEIAKDSKFKTIIKRSEVKADSAQVNIPEVGAYYWRSRQFLPDGTLHVSEPKRVIIEPVPAPEKPLKLPDFEAPLEDLPVKSSYLEQIINFILPSAHAAEEESAGIVRIDLPVKEDAKGFVVRIFRDEKLSDLVFEERLDSKHFEWINAKAGTYYWQYAVIDYWDRISLLSDPSVLTIKGDLTPKPEKPKLLSPIRAVEVGAKDLGFKFSSSQANHRFLLEISETDDFKKIIIKKNLKENEITLPDAKLGPKLYFWRVHAFNKKNQEVVSNTGRFSILPPREKMVIVDVPTPPVNVPQKTRKNRAFIAWTPSMDSYTFSDGETGKIDGTALMGAQLSGTLFKEDFILNAELLRQNGEVFEGESYLFQRLLLDGIKILSKENDHTWGVGVAVGQSSGQAYEIKSDQVVATSASGLSYGPILRNYLAINKKWELQGRVAYLLGGIKQMEVGADAIREFKSYLLIFGVGYASREYEISSGKQTAMKLSVGFGKEF
jgi:hypothetical protein